MGTDFTRDVDLLAERALLGCLLHRPATMPEVSGWLRAADFTDPWHTAVYTVIREQHTAHAPVTAESVGAGLADRLGARRANLPALVDLLHAWPDSPDPIGYARMVTENGLRREIASQGVLLRAGALHAVLTGTGRPAAAACDLVDAGLDSATRRWAHATTGREPSPDTTPVPLRAAARSSAVRLGADKLLALHPSPDPAAEHDHQVALIGALLAHDGAIQSVAGWLPPAQITDPAWRTLYATAVHLTELDQPADVVSVAWALRGPAHHGAPVPDLTTLLELVDASRFTPVTTAARAVAADLTRRFADRGAAALQTAATNTGLLLDDLIDTGRAITTAVRRAATALPATTTAGVPTQAEVRELRPTRGPVAG